MRASVTIVAIVFALALAGPAAAAVRVVKPAGSVSAGGFASLTVNVSPSARCSIGVYYSTRESRAAGLGKKAGSKITWRWRVGTNTKPGRWPIVVDCGTSGKVKTSIRTTA